MSIKDVSMLTADETEIKINSVLFTTEWSSGYDFKKEGEAKIESHRVISVDNSNRNFRTRCSRGCETMHRLADGCSKDKFFGTLEAARKDLVEKINYDVDKLMKKHEAVNKTLGHVQGQRKLASKMFPTKEPKAVKVDLK